MTNVFRLLLLHAAVGFAASHSVPHRGSPVSAQHAAVGGYTSRIVRQWASVYNGKPSPPPYFSNSTPSSNAWKSSAKLKYETFGASVDEYQNASSAQKAFLNYALAVAYEWEWFAAETSALLQSYYRDVMPFRTGAVAKGPWRRRFERPAAGRRFAAMTSAVVDAQIMHACRMVLSDENRRQKTNGSQLYAATWLAMNQELQFDVRSQNNKWYKYNTLPSINPVFASFSYKKTHFPIEFIPQFVWVALVLDIVAWEQKHADVQILRLIAKGAVLWAEALDILPIAQATLQTLKADDKAAVLTKQRLEGGYDVEAEVKLPDLMHLYGNASNDLRQAPPHVSTQTLRRFDSLLHKLNLVTR